MKPLVSIVLPVLNAGIFLKERMDSILAQTHRNFELLIVDSYSDDGSYEYMQSIHDPRIQLWQRPRGLYASWNEAIERARGEYIYIATADDTMTPDALEVMLDMLERHPECDICSSALEYIDQNSQPVRRGSPLHPGENPLWDFPLDLPHTRLAPHDGLICINGEMVTSSITQALIKKKVFDKIGLFPTRFGVLGDRSWWLAAGTCFNIAYVPKALSCWRIHASQATIHRKNFGAKEAANAVLDNLNITEWTVANLIADKVNAREVLKLPRFRLMLLSVTGENRLFDKLRAASRYFLQYPEEIVLYPAWFILKRLRKKDDLYSWRMRYWLFTQKKITRYIKLEK